MRLWQVETEGSIVVARYGNPPKNYFCAEAVAEFNAMLATWREPGVRAVILTGAKPGLFITHYSVEELHALARDPEEVRQNCQMIEEAFQVMVMGLRTLPVPVLVAMTGDTMGGGFELSMAADIRIAAAGDYRIGLPETRLGIIPGGTGTQTLTRLVGLARAVEFILRGRIVRPEEARQLGLVHEVAADPVARALDIAREIIAQPASAVAAAKEAVYRGSELAMDEALAVERAMFQRSMLAPEAAARMNAYLSQGLDQRRDWLERPPG